VNFRYRSRSHAKNSRWMKLAAKSETEQYASRREAEEAERIAIRAELPLFNVDHNEGLRRKAGWRRTSEPRSTGHPPLAPPAGALRSEVRLWWESRFSLVEYALDGVDPLEESVIRSMLDSEVSPALVARVIERRRSTRSGCRRPGA